MSSSELFNRAKWWLSQYAGLVPIRSNSKVVITGYGTYSKHITTEKHAWLWFEKLQVNLGIVCGGAIGLVCIDFDDTVAFDKWRVGPGRTFQTLIEQTARGYHVFVKCLGLPSFATPEAEIKARGIVMAAPSVHPTGKHYKVVTQAEIASTSVDEIKAHFPFIGEHLVKASKKPSAPKPSAPTHESSIVGDLVSRIKSARSVLEEAAELTDLKGRNGHFYGLCPFHDDHEPSFWVDDEAGLWGCYSPRCPSNAGSQKAHDVINLRMFAKHLPAREAIKELADEFLPR